MLGRGYYAVFKKNLTFVISKLKHLQLQKAYHMAITCKNKLFSSSFVYIFVFVVFFKKLTEQCPCKSELNLTLASHILPSGCCSHQLLKTHSLCALDSHTSFPAVLGVTSQSPSPSEHQASHASRLLLQSLVKVSLPLNFSLIHLSKLLL